MSYDLELGLTEKPTDLEGVLAQKGFKLSRTIPAVGHFPRIDVYGNSEMELNYADGLHGDEDWGITSLNFVAHIRVCVWGTRTEEDERNALELAKSLRDRYRAILIDPSDGKIIRD